MKGDFHISPVLGIVALIIIFVVAMMIITGGFLPITDKITEIIQSVLSPFIGILS